MKVRSVVGVLVGIVLLVVAGLVVANRMRQTRDANTDTVTQIGSTENSPAVSARTLNPADANGLVAAQTLQCVPRGHDNYRTNHALAVDPKDENIAYVGVEYKGVFKTTDGGATWKQSDTGIRGYAMESDTTKKCIQELGRMIIDPADNQHLLISRVESPGDLTTMFTENAGVYESFDGGATWQQMVKPGMNASGSQAIAFDPQNSKTIYYGINNMTPSFLPVGDPKAKLFNKTGIVYQTVNGGIDWRELTTGAEEGFRAMNVAVDSQDSKKLWLFTFNQDAATGGVAAEAKQKGVMVSSDGGATWTSLASKFPDGYRTLAGGWLSPKDGKNAFITTQTQTTGPKSFATKDGGETWGESNVYILAAAYDPNDASGHRLLGYGPYQNTPGVYESMDGGITWKLLSKTPAEVTENGSQQIRIMSFAWSQSNKNVVYMSGSGGYVWKSEDNGKTWKTVMTLDSIGGKNKNKAGSEMSSEPDQ